MTTYILYLSTAARAEGGRGHVTTYIYCVTIKIQTLGQDILKIASKHPALYDKPLLIRTAICKIAANACHGLGGNRWVEENK